MPCTPSCTMWNGADGRHQFLGGARYGLHAAADLLRPALPAFKPARRQHIGDLRDILWVNHEIALEGQAFWVVFEQLRMSP